MTTSASDGGGGADGKTPPEEMTRRPKRPKLQLVSEAQLSSDLAAAGSGNAPSLVSEPSVPDNATVDDYTRVIDKLWLTAQRTFVQIGRYLEEAQTRLVAEDFSLLCARLPFGRSARSQLMQAYRAVSQHRLPAGIERAGYSTVYEASKLSEPDLQRAITEGVVRPDMKRSDLLSFKKRIRNDDDAEPQRIAALTSERDRLMRRVHDIDAELARLGVG